MLIILSTRLGSTYLSAQAYSPTCSHGQHQHTHPFRAHSQH
jgi:hypothetical protein